MYNNPEKNPENNMSLAAIASSKTYLLAFAKYFPDEKDAIMELILRDATILPKLADRAVKSQLFEICCAYPNYATEIAIQLFANHAKNVREYLDDFGLSETTFIVFCLLMMSLGYDEFHYEDFIRVFPRESEEIFGKLCENDAFFRSFMCHSSRFKTTFAQLPQYQDKLVAALLRQPDDYWLEYFTQLAMLFLVIRSCEARHHRLFERYFEIEGLYQEQVQLIGVEPFVEKLINLILVDSYSGYNEFGVDMLKAIVRYYPQYQEAIFKALHDNPSVLSGFITNGPYIFREMLNEFPQRMPLILDTLSKLPAHPGLIGLFTHGIISGDVAVADIALLNHYSLDKARVVMDRLFSDQVLLTATLNVRRCSDYFALALLAPNNKDKVIEVFAQCYKDELAVLSDLSYVGVFPEEMWLWLDMLRVPGFILNESLLGGLVARDYYLKDICQLFPEYKDELIRYFASNRKLAFSVFCNVDWLLYAAQQAPQLQGQLMSLFCEFCSLTEIDIHNAEEGDRDKVIGIYSSYRKVNYNDVFAAFPLHRREILRVIFGNEVGFSRFQRDDICAVYEFAHQYPEDQGLLINALKTYPAAFNPMVKDPETLYAFFLLMPNRHALAMALSINSKIAYVGYDNLQTALASISELEIYLPVFLETLFIRREVLECVFSAYVLPKWLKSPQYQSQFLGHYCQYPEYLDKYEINFFEGLREENSRLLLMASILNHNNKIKDFDLLDDFLTQELIAYQGLEGKATIRVLIKLVDRMMAIYDAESVERGRLLALRERMVPLAFATLQMFCVQKIIGDEDAMKVVRESPHLRSFF